MTETVLLIGGPFDGQEREVQFARRVLTLEWSEGVRQESFGGVEVQVERLNFATYERRSDGAFHYAPGHPAEVADDERWDARQLTIEEDT